MPADDPGLWLPEAGAAPSERELRRYFANVRAEIAAGDLPPSARGALHGYYREAGLLDRPFKREFFFQHYARNLATALTFLGDGDLRERRILDLGCGLGTQTLLMALLGARVTAVDRDRDALEIARRRVAAYETAAGRPLAVTFVAGDALQLDFAAFGSCDGLFSLFAFNMIQPTSTLLARLAPALGPSARLAIQDGNPRMWFNRLLRPRAVCDARTLTALLERQGFQSPVFRGGYAVPPPLWVAPTVAGALDRLLRDREVFAVSWLVLAQRGP